MKAGQGTGRDAGRSTRRAGFTLIELMIVIAIIGVFSGLGAMAMGSWFGEQRAKGAARSIANLVVLARQEAIRTRVDHLVFFNLDAEDSTLQDPDGVAVAALLISDADADGKVDAGEYVASIPFNDTGELSWGVTFATAAAPNDNPGGGFPRAGVDACCTFLDTASGDARWVAFSADGTPRSFKIGPYADGGTASGNGAVYITNGTRDYAAVVSALGAVHVHGWDKGAGAWQR